MAESFYQFGARSFTMTQPSMHVIRNKCIFILFCA
ncbi:Uncharacterised protein [Raoultella terrigena]|uniref:Uncharacterized protein n=1 Tax=Raoultella terrigena TaxID=577 RepID=A0A4U9D5C1_RAOTE|nr:Uncharacterised protein [Raoultella terrigena]